jgi:cytochrome c peroxidase
MGRYLFFDTRLSLNNTKSCASCHDPQFAFSDGYRRSITATGDIVEALLPLKKYLRFMLRAVEN